MTFAGLGLPAGDILAQGSAETDRAALVALYDATDGPSWKNSANWLTDAPLSDWHGVSTDGNGRVTELILTENVLKGPLPSDLGQLTRLRQLNLNQNELTGPIPDELGALVSLEGLSLGGNALTGPIPSSFGDLANLRALVLWRNQLTGALPPTLWNLTGLDTLVLWRNRLTGPIPRELSRLPRLFQLELDENDLTGPIPAELGDLREMQSLTLGGNLLEGPIPSTLGNLTRLLKLDLAFNERLTGPLPSGLQRSRLEDLALGGTLVCVPADAAFQSWLKTIEELYPSGHTCGVPPAAMTTIDVAVFYTPAARAEAGGDAQIHAEIDLMVAEANQAYADSGVHVRIALVARAETPYTEVRGELDYNRLRKPSDGFMDEVHEVRDRVGADLIHLVPRVISHYGLCGRAALPGIVGLTGLGCGGRAFVHEIGHNLGLNHDRYVTCNDIGCRDWPYRYGYGYVNQRAFVSGAPTEAAWLTIMAYHNQCADAGVRCHEPLRFASPRQTWRGDPLGVAGDHVTPEVDGPADAVRVLNFMRHAAASYRDRVVGSPPVAVGALPDRSLHVSGGPVVVAVGGAFRDPDGHPLTYSAISSPPGIVATRVAGPQVTLIPVAAGRADVTVTAADFTGSASQRFAVTVGAGAIFTDHEIRPGVTPVRAVHFRELRQRIDALRARAGRPPFRWTDPLLSTGMTIRGVHLAELRSALDEAYVAQGRARPRYTDATVTPGATTVKAVHVMELRAAVVALE